MKRSWSKKNKNKKFLSKTGPSGRTQYVAIIRGNSNESLDKHLSSSLNNHQSLKVLKDAWEEE